MSEPWSMARMKKYPATESSPPTIAVVIAGRVARCSRRARRIAGAVMTTAPEVCRHIAHSWVPCTGRVLRPGNWAYSWTRTSTCHARPDLAWALKMIIVQVLLSPYRIKRRLQLENRSNAGKIRDKSARSRISATGDEKHLSERRFDR